MKSLYERHDQTMELLPEADAVVRHFMPCLTDAAGLEDMSSELRSLGPIECKKSLAAACRALARVRSHGAPRAGGPWKETLQEASFWGEAALWSAARGDYCAFMEQVERMRMQMKELPEQLLH